MAVVPLINCYVNLSSNGAAAKMLIENYTHLLLWDVDIVPKPEHLARLVAHDEDIVGGMFPKKKQGNIEWVCNALSHRPEPDKRGLLELLNIGAGFLLIKRGVFEAMMDVFGKEIGYKDYVTNDQLWDFFSIGVVNDRMLTHDWYFCHRARQLGYKIWGDTKVILGHIGNVTFPLESQMTKVK